LAPQHASVVNLILILQTFAEAQRWTEQATLIEMTT
jgi:hypothetical protein